MTTAPQTTAHSSGESQNEPTTQVEPPRHRIFLPRTFRERVACAMWSFLSPLIFRFTPAALNRWRILVLRCFRARIDWSSFIHPSVRIDYPWNLRIGPECVIEHGVILNAMGQIEIGPRCRISQYAHLCAGTHEYCDTEMPIVRKPITINADVWIAADAFVGPGVTIGEGSLLAARSSAFGSLPAGHVCVGEPAVPRQRRFLHS